MKNTSKLFLAAFSAIMCAVSCKPREEQTKNESATYIPENSPYVLAVNPGELLSQSKVLEDEKALASLGVFGELLKDIPTSGLDVSENMFAFGHGKGTALVAKVGDSGKFMNTLSRVLPVTENESEYYAYGYGFELFGDYAIAYKGDDNLPADSIRLVIDGIARREKPSVTNYAIFQDMLAGNAVAGIYFNAYYAENLSAEHAAMLDKLDFDGSGYLDISSENNLMTLSYKTDKAPSKLKNAFGVYTGRFNRLIPAGTRIFAGFNIDGSALTNTYTDNSTQDLTKIPVNRLIRQMVSALKGDVTVGIDRLTLREGRLTGDGVLYAEADTETLASLLAEVVRRYGSVFPVSAISENTYMVRMTGQPEVEIGIKDGYLYAKFGEGIAAGEDAYAMPEGTDGLQVYANMDADRIDPAVMRMTGIPATYADNIIRYTDYIDFEAYDGLTAGQIGIHLKDNANPLELILNIILKSNK